MENIFWLGQAYFADELEKCGWRRVFQHDFSGLRAYSWNDLISLAGFVPDVLVVADKSLPPFIMGMEEFPCLTVFYSVDAHIHSWQPAYAQGFDVCLLSLLDFAPTFAGPFLPSDRIWNSPPFARSEDQPLPGAQKKWDGLFVGKLDEQLMPKRVAFFRELQKRVPNIHLTSGDYRPLFPRAKVVLNHVENEDLNFRVFEAMGCGGCLLTPRVNHGLQQLFVDGEHLLFYAPDDPGDAAYRLNFILEHPDIGDHIGAEALKIIDEKHRAIHRAQSFTDRLCDLHMSGASEIIDARIKRASKIRKESLAMPYLLWANEIKDDKLKQAWLAAARGEYGLSGV